MKKHLRLIRSFFMMALSFYISAAFANAQSLTPMGKGLKYPAVDLYADSSGANKLALQIVSINYDSLLTTYLISKWTGESWVDAVTVTLQAVHTDHIHCLRSMAVYNGEIYIGGRFRGVGRIYENVYEGVLRWDGTGWQRLPSLNKLWGLDAYKMVVCAGKLFIAGELRINDTTRWVSRWNGTEWSFPNPNSGGYVFDMDILNGKIFMGGALNLVIDGKTIQGTGIWDESQQKWVPMKSSGGWYLMEVAAKSDTTWLNHHGPGVSPTLHNTTVSYSWGIPGLPLWVDPYFQALFSYRTSNHVAYALGTFWMSIRTNESTSALFYMDNDRWIRYPAENLGVFFGPPRIQKSNDTLLICGTFKRNGSTFLDNVAMITEKPLPSIRVHGKVFNDADKDCVYDSLEQGLARISLKIEPGNFIVQSDKKGEYEVYLPKGEYSVSLLEKGPYKAFCKDSLRVDSLDSRQDFGLRSEIRNHSVSISSSEGFKAPKGRFQKHMIRLENYSDRADSVLLIYEYDSNLHWAGCNLDPLSHEKHKAIFFVQDIKAFEGKDIIVKLLNDTLASGHTRMKSRVDLHPDSKQKEIVTEDDNDSLPQEIIAPFDPNDKQVWPPEVLMPDQKVLKYHIRFQNVGSAPAMKVRVVDTIDSKIPVENITVTRASHDYSLYIRDNVLTWIFDNINLMDSTTDEEASKGFISYTAKLKEGLSIGSKIKNTAYIYFDWEAPVITNTVVNTLEDWPQSVKSVKPSTETLWVYPNPVSDKLIIQNIANSATGLRMTDLLGRVVWTGQLIQGGNVNIDVNSFTAGIYFLSDENGHSSRVLIVH